MDRTIRRAHLPIIPTLAAMFLSISGCGGGSDPESGAAAAPAGPAAGSARSEPGGDRASGTQEAAAQAPVLVQPQAVDFGVVDPGTLLSTVVRMVNVSDRPQRIVKAQPSCTCTTLDLDGRVIPPRGSIEVPVEMQTNRAVGNKQAIVQVVFEGYSRFTTIDLKAEAAWGVRTQPLYLGVRERPDQPEVRKGVINLQSRDGRPFNVISANGEPPVFVGFDPASDDPRASYTISYDLSGYGCEDLPPYYVIRTDHPKAELFDMRVRHDPCTRLRPMINMEDFRSSLGVVSPGEQLTVPLVFKKPRANILSATSLDPVLETRIVERVPDGQNIKVEILTVISPDATEGLFQVPIRFTDGQRTVDHTFYGWVEG